MRDKILGWILANRRDLWIYLGVALFITVMHGVNQSRIHRESAALYWGHVQPQLIQRYVGLQKDPKLARAVPELFEAQKVLTYKVYPETYEWAQKVEQKISAEYPGNRGWVRRARPFAKKLTPHPELNVELSRYNQTVNYVNEKEEGWLYKLALLVVKRDGLSVFVLAR